MADRKVLNFYIPPDFDPTKLPKGVRHKRIEATMMLPFSIQCTTCGEFMSRGKKFNAKVEEIEGHSYLGFRVWRFIGKCVGCNAPYSFKTDPKNMDYAPEAGITRNYEPWREQAAAAEKSRENREEEERLDAMRALENRTLDSRIQMDITDALEEMRAMRARQAHLDADDLLATVAAAKGDDARSEDVKKAAEEAALEAEEVEALRMFHASRQHTLPPQSAAPSAGSSIGDGSSTADSAPVAASSLPSTAPSHNIRRAEPDEPRTAATAGIAKAVLAPKLVRRAPTLAKPGATMATAPVAPRLLVRPRPITETETVPEQTASKRPRTEDNEGSTEAAAAQLLPASASTQPSAPNTNVAPSFSKSLVD